MLRPRPRDASGFAASSATDPRMRRPMKIAAIAALAGLMMAVAVMALLAPRPSPERGDTVAKSPAHDPLAAELARCRALTMPDAGCEAAWDTHRRRFLGNEGDVR